LTVVIEVVGFNVSAQHIIDTSEMMLLTVESICSISGDDKFRVAVTETLNISVFVL